jgi:type IV fimbrial biogenesis protein FimT
MKLTAINNPKQKGFTLIELMVAIVIMGVVLVVGIPSFRTWIENGQIRTGANSLFNGLNLARGEAIRRNETVQFRFDPAFKSTWAVCQADNAGAQTFNLCFPLVPAGNNALGANVLHANFDHSKSSNVQIGTSNVMGDPRGAPLTAGLGANASTVTFDGLGRLTGANNAVRVDIINPKIAAAKMRRLVIQIFIGGEVRECDPDLGLSNTDPRRCTI